MKPFIVHMQHHQRYNKNNPHPVVEHIEVHVEGKTGDDAVQAAKAALGPDWQVRCVMFAETKAQ